MKIYVDDDGYPKPDRRCRNREDDDPRIAHLFNGFDNVIANAEGYTKGYVQAMRLEFGQLIASLVRPTRVTERDQAEARRREAFDTLPDDYEVN